MDEAKLREKIVTDFTELVNDIADAQTFESSDNPFKKVVLSDDFLRAKLTAPVLKDQELKSILGEIDKAMEQDRQLKEIVQLVGKGLKVALKFL